MCLMRCPSFLLLHSTHAAHQLLLSQSQSLQCATRLLLTSTSLQTRPSASLQSLILAAAIIVLPTVWLRDLSLLSFLSVGGIFASLALLALVGWEGVAVAGFPHDRPPLVTWSGVPVSIGLFCFCFSGGCLLGWGRVCTVGLSCAQPPRHCRFCC